MNPIKEVPFLLSVWKANLLSAMEYRGAFISQVVGMMVNNAMYFLFWVFFFNQFKQVRGWGLQDMFVMYGVVAAGFGLSVLLFGNIISLATIITQGRLDYFLSFPRPVLLHALVSRSIPSGLGDFMYGLLSYLMLGIPSLDSLIRYCLALLFSVCVFLSFLVLVNSLAFWTGSASMLVSHATNALITFSLYPTSLFDGPARLLLLTIIPAAFVGAIPAELIRSFSWGNLILMLVGATAFLSISILVFHYGLRRYESGSAIQNQV